MTPFLLSALIATSSSLLTVPSASFIANTATQAITEQATADTLGVKVSEVAQKYSISSTKLNNLIQSESGGDPTANGDQGCSLGITQINICAHTSVSEAQALNTDFSLNWTAKQIASGNDWWWTSCNCYSYVQANFIRNLPRMSEIQPNSVARKGGVAIFYYTDRETGEIVKHIAYETSVSHGTITLAEANKEPCLVGTRVINTGDAYYAGTWYPYAV